MNTLPTNNDNKNWLDKYERVVDNILRILWIAFIIKIVLYGYS